MSAINFGFNPFRVLKISIARGGSNFAYVNFFRVRKIFRTQVFAGFAVFSFCV